MNATNTFPPCTWDFWGLSPRKPFSAVFAAALVLAMAPTAVRAENVVPRVLDLAPAQSFAELTFAPGQSTLDPFARQNLEQMIREANLRGTIDQVRVISWGDLQEATPTPAQINLAASRAKSVEEFIRVRGNGLTVNTYNLAEKPTALQELLNGTDAKFNLTLNQAGIAWGQAAKPSKVLVVLVTH